MKFDSSSELKDQTAMKSEVSSESKFKFRPPVPDSGDPINWKTIHDVTKKFLHWCPFKVPTLNQTSCEYSLASLAFFAIFLGLTLCSVATGFVSFQQLSNVQNRERRSTSLNDGKTRDLRDRIKSVKNTKKLTEAMRLVAAARVRRAQDAVMESRPMIARLQDVSQVVSSALFIILRSMFNSGHHSFVLYEYYQSTHVLTSWPHFVLTDVQVHRGGCEHRGPGAAHPGGARSQESLSGAHHGWVLVVILMLYVALCCIFGVWIRLDEK